MIKKLLQLYGESIRLGVRYPLFVLFFVILNALTLAGLLKVNSFWLNVTFIASFLIKVTVQAAIGYGTIRLLRGSGSPEKMLSHGVIRNYWPVLKYSFLQLVLLSLTYYLPVAFLSGRIFVAPIAQSLWFWLTDYLFVFLIYEALFWEDKGVRYAYRMRNIFMLDRFEWMFPVYFVARLPHILIALLGPDWLYSGVGFFVMLLFLSVFDWVNNLFTFKVYGVDRLQVAREMEERIKEATKARKAQMKERKKS